MDTSKIFMVNQEELCSLISSLIEQALTNKLSTYEDDVFAEKVKDIISQDGHSLIEDEIADQVANILRYDVSISIDV